MLEEKTYKRQEWRFIKDAHYLWVKTIIVISYGDLCNNSSKGDLAGGCER